MDNKSRAFSWLTCGTNFTTMSFYNSTTNCQPHTSPLIICPGMKPLEHIEDAVRLFFIEAEYIQGEIPILRKTQS